MNQNTTTHRMNDRDDASILYYSSLSVPLPPPTRPVIRIARANLILLMTMANTVNSG